VIRIEDRILETCVKGEGRRASPRGGPAAPTCPRRCSDRSELESMARRVAKPVRRDIIEAIVALPAAAYRREDRLHVYDSRCATKRAMEELGGKRIRVLTASAPGSEPQTRHPTKSSSWMKRASEPLRERIAALHPKLSWRSSGAPAKLVAESLDRSGRRSKRTGVVDRRRGASVGG